MSYNFSTVSGVLPLGTQRAYVPRAARPHLMWSTTTTTAPGALGTQCRLKGDGTAARAQAADDGDACAPAASERGMAALLTTDAATGTHLTLYANATAPQQRECGPAIPSGRRIVALWAPATDHCADLAASAPLFASDDVGGVFAYRGLDAAAAAALGTKRRRDEAGTEAGAWVDVVPAASALTSGVARLQSVTAPLADLFTVTRGAPGWAGLAALSGESAESAAPRLVSVREFYQDVRLIDPARQTVVRTYSTTHAPTGVFCPSAQAAPHCALVVEGCLATLYDVRCPSAVLSLAEVYEAQAEWRSAKDTERKDGAAASPGDATGAETTARDGAGAPARAAPPPPPPPLIPGRLTSTAGQVRDVCGTANPFEVACAVDRALCVYDLRKFNRLFTSSSVLKYVVGSVASVAGGRGVVCAGIDAEVRLIPLHDKAEAATAEALSLAARVATQAQQKRKQHTDALKAGETDVEAMGPGGTFRTRLSTSVSCTSVWQGGWVTACNDGGAAAAGVSVDGEVFLVQ